MPRLALDEENVRRKDFYSFWGRKCLAFFREHKGQQDGFLRVLAMLN